MATIAFDTLKFAKRLKEAGILPAQAEAEAEALAEVLEVNLKELATKEDLHVVKKDLQQEIELLRRDMKEMEQRMVIKLGAMMMAAVAVVAALVKLL